jgi:hypothetical protein
MYTDKEGYNYCDTCPNLGAAGGVLECKEAGPTKCDNTQYNHFLSTKDGNIKCKRCGKYADECNDDGDTKCTEKDSNF